jgi:hypothetical protein
MTGPQIWSLLDIMRQFDAWMFAENVREITWFFWIAVMRTKEDQHGKIEDRILPEIQQLVQDLAAQLKSLDCKFSFRRAVELNVILSGAYGHAEWTKLKDEIHILWQTLTPELIERRFAFIAVDKNHYLDELGWHPAIHAKEKDKAVSRVWANIWKRFPSAKYECEEAVYCCVFERHTACVFHSMRTAEIGLRALARRMKVKLPKGKRLEWAEWQQVLKEMHSVSEKVSQTMKAGPVKDETLEFYRGAIGQFYGFKDEFRNQVMHVRKNYDGFQAASALTRVHDFMDKLANKIDERGRRVRT